MYGTCGRIDNKADFDFDICIHFGGARYIIKVAQKTATHGSVLFPVTVLLYIYYIYIYMSMYIYDILFLFPPSVFLKSLFKNPLSQIRLF